MSVISYKCPNCDGELIFDPKTQKYKCEYCMSLFSQEELEAMKPETQEEQQVETVNEETAGDSGTEQDFSGNGEENVRQEQSAGNAEETVIYNCPSCGAEIVTDATTAATFCYYCHNPVVLGGRLSGEFLPDQVVPFTIDKKTAENKFLEFLNKKKYIPRAFFNKKQMEHLSGVYFPYWVYETSMKGRMQARATKTRVWRNGDTEYTETRFFEVERQGDIVLKDMTENALKKANHVLAEGILPYRMEEAKPFHSGFLSGFLAEKRDIEKEDVHTALKAEAEEYAGNLLRESVTGYQTVTDQQKSFSGKKEKFSYTLLPVWTLTYKGRDGNTYYYSMNGQTGKVCGKLPVDYKKVACTALISAAAVFLAGLVGGYFIW